jgi:hypothetical protein
MRGGENNFSSSRARRRCRIAGRRSCGVHVRGGGGLPPASGDDRGVGVGGRHGTTAVERGTGQDYQAEGVGLGRISNWLIRAH